MIISYSKSVTDEYRKEEKLWDIKYFSMFKLVLYIFKYFYINCIFCLNYAVLDNTFSNGCTNFLKIIVSNSVSHGKSLDILTDTWRQVLKKYILATS